MCAANRIAPRRKEFRSGEKAPRLAAILLHLRHERFERIELRFGPQEMGEGDFDFLPVEIARKVEEIGLEQFLGRIELRANADIGSALQFLPCREDAPGDRLDAVLRAQIMFDRQVRGRIADFAPALVAMLDHAANGEGAGEKARGFLRVAFAQGLAHAAR